MRYHPILGGQMINGEGNVMIDSHAMSVFLVSM